VQQTVKQTNSQTNSQASEVTKVIMSESKVETKKDGSYGRVVLLHFACRAALPIGSCLRVSSSELWCPGMLTPDDPMDAERVSRDAASDANSMSVESQHYASSVAMVTSPEDWPVWRTRTPVVVALRKHHGRGVLQHRYRYMVITPGADNLANASNEEMQSIEGVSGMDAVTSPENSSDGVGVEVMAWEDPFSDRQSQLELRRMSADSLPSVRNKFSKSLANLPYRTIEIDTTTAQVKYNQRGDDIAIDMDSDENCNQGHATYNGIWIDHWNKADDLSFCAYSVRDGINKQKKAQVVTQDSHMTEANPPDVSAPPTIESRVSFGQLNQIIPTAVEDDAGLMTPSPMVMTPRQPILTKTITARKKQRIFFVCFHLPVIVRKDLRTSKWSAIWAESLLAPAVGSSIVRSYEAYWVGTVTGANCPIVTQDDRDAVRVILNKMNCSPLFLDEDTHEKHYMGMCKQVLWPAFHNIDLLDLSASGWIPPEKDNSQTHNSAPKTEERTNIFNFSGKMFKKATKSEGVRQTNSDWDQSRLDAWWEAYCQVNEAFAAILSSKLQSGDIMWVHDYHLALLPKLVDQQEYTSCSRSITKKVFFLHIPFPTSQIFRELECGRAILDGMLHADVVGFHAYDHARHFLNASKRILGLNYESLVGGLIGIVYEKKIVLVTMHNVSVEPGMVDAALKLPSVINKAATIRDQYPSRIVIVGVDIAQRLSGISLKLLAFERFLADYPIWQEKVVMVQKCLLPCSRREDEKRSIREVRYLVNRIKEKFGPSVIDCEEIAGSSLPIVERLALWKTADVLMVTPIREGLNLLPFEYVFAKKKPASPGVVISSEFSTVCSVMNGVIRVNPYDIQMTVAGIDKALTMDAEDKERRRCRDTAFVQSSPSSEWMESVLHDLNDATTVADYANYGDTGSQDTGITNPKYNSKDAASTTADFLVREKEKAFTHLDTTSVCQVYNKTKNRVIVLDLNGTVIDKETPGKYLKGEFFSTRGHKPSQNVCQALRILCSDPRNTVFVVSGDSQENVVNAIGDITGLGLAASNGACFAPPLKPNETHRQWKYFDLGVNWDAVKKIVLPVFAKYTARSNGSFVKMTHSSIGWSYYSCDPEWGSLQASQLVMELENALRPFDVRFVMIKGIVEIVPMRLNKGLIVKNVLREVSNRDVISDVDFILCMGDDIQDEKMFTSVFSFIAELEDPTHPTLSPPVIDDGGAPISASVSASNDKDDVPALQCTKTGNHNPLFAFTVAVGKKESHAFAYVDDAQDVGSLLVKLSGRNVRR